LKCRTTLREAWKGSPQHNARASNYWAGTLEFARRRQPDDWRGIPGRGPAGDEILFGLETLDRGRRRTEVEEKARKFFDVLPCEPIRPAAGDQCAHVRISQQRLGLPSDENAPWIAATALAMSATLVSGDSDFQRIEGLQFSSHSLRRDGRVGLAPGTGSGKT